MTCMRCVRTMACVSVAIALTVALLSGSALAATADSRRKIVILDSPLTQAVFDSLAAAGITVLYNLSLINALAVQLPAPPLLNLALALLDDLGQVYNDLLTSVDPICPTTSPPSVQEYRWGMRQIEADLAHQRWPSPSQTEAVMVAVLDTGVQSHVELDRRIVQGYNAITGTGQPADIHGHGTHMTGIILANKNGVGVIGGGGVEPKIIVAPVKVLDDSGAGYASVVIKGLEWVLNNGIPLVNMSFGFSRSNESDGTPLRQAIQMLSNADIIMVASAGNRCSSGASEDGGGDDCGPAATCKDPLTAITAPAAYPGVLAVGAADINGQIPAYSLSGPQLAVVAPGGAPKSGAPDNGQILSTNIGGTYGRGHGTSQAAAHVTGAIALALALDPELTSSEVRNLVTQTAVAGRIDVNNMIEDLLP
jgi:subtilisin family serine protease